MKKVQHFLGWLITLLLPLMIIFTSARIIFTPFYLNYEYQSPKFPADEFGFSTQERLKWANISLDYLFNDQGIEFLANQKMADGNPLYNERELSHMLDVKKLIQACVISWIAIAGFFVLMAVWSWRGKWQETFWQAIMRGGWLTVGLIVAILAAIAMSFDQFFTNFHHLFFTGDSWLFFETDSLIRLFPLKLWSDGFTFVGIFSLTFGIVLGAIGHKLKHKYQ